MSVGTSNVEQNIGVARWLLTTTEDEIITSRFSQLSHLMQPIPRERIEPEQPASQSSHRLGEYISPSHMSQLV